jgi:hypothetical protein
MSPNRHYVPLRLGILVPESAPRLSATRIRTARPSATRAARNAVYQDRVTSMMAGWARQTAS